VVVAVGLGVGEEGGVGDRLGDGVGEMLGVGVGFGVGCWQPGHQGAYLHQASLGRAKISTSSSTRKTFVSLIISLSCCRLMVIAAPLISFKFLEKTAW